MPRKWFRRFRYYFQFFPLTAQGLLILAVFLLSYYVMFSAPEAETDEVDSFAGILNLLAGNVFWFMLFFVLFGLLSTCISWLIYLIRKRRKGSVAFKFDTHTSSGGVWVTPDRRLLQPPLGAVRVRLVYDELELTPRFYWKGGGLARKRTSSQFLSFDDVKTYRLRGSFLFFEDLFRIFSFPVYHAQEGDFFRGPQAQPLAMAPTEPRVAETAEVKTRQLRRIPGDFLNYKTFESGDDIRRIVWKLYAKNRELIVRKPEEKDRYASLVYLYASFHNALFRIGANGRFAREMLNYYKNTIWSVYDALLRQDMPVKFEPDQLFRSSTEGLEPMRMGLSNCAWQENMGLTAYFDKRKGSVVLISSFNEAADVERLLTEAPRDVKIIMVKLSSVFEHPFLSDWISRIFMRAPEDRLKRVRAHWLFSPLRLPLMRNERTLIKLLEDTDRDVSVL